MTEATPTATPFDHQQTARHSERPSDDMAYDEKDNMALLREKLAQRKKPIYAGLAFLCVVVIGVSIGVSATKTTSASNASGYTAPTPTPTTAAPTPAPAPSADESATAGVHGVDLTTAGSVSTGSSSKSSFAGSVAGEASLEEDLINQKQGSQAGNSTATPATTAPAATTAAPTPAPVATTAAPTQAPTAAPSGPALPWKALDFNWKDPSNWEYSSGAPVAGGMVGPDGIKLTPGNSAQPIRTKQGWGGEKIVYIEWERSDSSDTNIWMLNTKLQNQFGVGNGWPYWGELDIFEMFTQDKALQPQYDFSGFGPYSDVASYGQLTLHNGPRKEDGQPCFCPAAYTKSVWYQNSQPMTSGCTAQFANTPKNSIATVWGTDGTGQYLQLLQNPKITTGGKVNGVQTYDIQPGGTTTMKIYNNKDLFWGTPASAPCAAGGGHNPATGFPFFEDFRLILEEQKKNDGSAWFKVNNIQIFKK